ncbi:MAG: Ppyr-DeCO2ase: phosphonopyruvate decarboxylase [Pantoea stewartii]|uniref:hypothetical protein n=1 Tax=Pantoea stewartii TaxID=66269 RepID=UPI0024BE93EB|nr:hypothetical protein [Pantoea stewartii]WHS97195.1 MAG: Ppyr-DeCO2ase: phosphonopyruvate decarboxylase [Pantoea stewartii]
MNKNELIKMVITKFASHPIIFTTGYASRIAYLLKPEAVNHFYMVGSMGMASAIGRGVASQLSDNSHCPVIVDGEGALLRACTAWF